MKPDELNRLDRVFIRLKFSFDNKIFFFTSFLFNIIIYYFRNMKLNYSFFCLILFYVVEFSAGASISSTTSKVIDFRTGSSEIKQKCVCLSPDACDSKDVIDFTRPEYLNVSDTNCNTQTEVCCREKNNSPKSEFPDVDQFTTKSSSDADPFATQSTDGDTSSTPSSNGDTSNTPTSNGDISSTPTSNGDTFSTPTSNGDTSNTPSSDGHSSTQSPDVVTITAVDEPNCTCVPFYQCNDTDFIDYNNVSSFKKEIPGGCTLGEVCCYQPIEISSSSKMIPYRLGSSEDKQQRCKCVLFFECAIKDSIDFSKPEFLKDNGNVTCPNDGEVCCRESDDVTASSTPSSKSPLSTSSPLASHKIIDFKLDSMDGKPYSCDCVPFYLCDESEIIDFSRPEFVNSSESNCDSGEVCCRDSGKLSVQSVPSAKSLDYPFTEFSHQYQSCVCVPVDQCNGEGAFAGIPGSSDGSVSACAHENEVCCHHGFFQSESLPYYFLK